MSKKVKNTDRVPFKETRIGDKLTIKADVEIVNIEDVPEYLKLSGAQDIKKVTCNLKTGPFRDREGTFIILEEDMVNLHSRPTFGQQVWKFFFGKKKKKASTKAAKKS